MICACRGFRTSKNSVGFKHPAITLPCDDMVNLLFCVAVVRVPRPTMELMAASHCQQLADLAANTPPSTTVCIDPPTLDEVRSAITSLKNGRAGGLDGIAPELLKYAIEPIASGLQSLFTKVWNSGKVPADWRDGVVVPLYKGKGSK